MKYTITNIKQMKDMACVTYGNICTQQKLSLANDEVAHLKVGDTMYGFGNCGGDDIALVSGQFVWFWLQPGLTTRHNVDMFADKYFNIFEQIRLNHALIKYLRAKNRKTSVFLTTNMLKFFERR